MLFVAALLIVAVQVNEEQEQAPQDRYSLCVLRAVLQKMPSRQIAELSGRRVTSLVNEVARMSCAEERKQLAMSLPEEKAEFTVRVTDNVLAGLLIDGDVEVAPATSCLKQIKRDGVCF